MMRCVACITILAIWVLVASSPSPANGAWADAQEQELPYLLRTTASQTLLDEGRVHLFAFRFTAAENRFRALLRRPDGEAASYYHLATVAFYKGLVTDDEAYFERSMARIDSLRQSLEARPESVWSRQMLAKSELMRVVAAGKLQRYLRAAWSARSAFKKFEDLLEDHPGFTEAYLGMGLLHLTVASLPAGWRDLLSVLGFQGTAPQALSELQRAARHSRYNRREAQLALATADLVLLQNVERGTERMAQLYDEDPESLLYKHLYGFALQTNRQAGEAERILRSAVARDGPTYFYINYLDYYLAETLFVQGRYGEATTYYESFLERHDGLAIQAMSRYRLGLALEMQGQRDAATTWYAAVRGERDFDSDNYAKRWAQKRLRTPMTALGRKELRGQNAFQSGRYAQAERLLRNVFDAPDATPAQRSHAAYFIGQTLRVQGNYDAAYPAYYYAVQHPGDPKAQWRPWSQLFIAEMHLDQGRREAAIRAYENALDFDTPYDYYQSLEQTARIALEQLRAEDPDTESR